MPGMLNHAPDQRERRYTEEETSYILAGTLVVDADGDLFLIDEEGRTIRIRPGGQPAVNGYCSFPVQIAHAGIILTFQNEG